MADRPTYVWTGSEWDTIADPGAVRKTGGSTITVSSGSTVPLTIQNNGTGNSLVVNDEASDTSPFVVNASGNIGIGTASPSGAVHISRNATEAVRVETAGTGATPSYYMLASRGTPGSRTALSSGDLTGQIVAWGYNGTDYGQSAVLNFVADGAPSGSTVPGRLEVYTTSSGGSPTERIRITSTGRVQLPAGSVLEAPVSTNAQTASYTLVLTDAGRLIEINNAGATTLTIPADASVAFPVGTKIDVLQTGAGQVTIAGSGFTPNATPGLKISAQWGAATLVKRGTNSWVVIGNLSA